MPEAVHRTMLKAYWKQHKEEKSKQYLENCLASAGPCEVISGFSFAIGAQLVAASIEYARKGAPVLPVPSHCAPKILGFTTLC